ncbi:MAG: hypothetical protein LBC72_01355 [Spirochaetaceae bacterium]|jgi:hypothetical protein|nr:hypothetical protein [Spirochaetaceae bacterium]
MRKWFWVFFVGAALRVFPQTITLSGGIDNSFYDKGGTAVNSTPLAFINARGAIDGSFGGLFGYEFLFENDTVDDYLVNIRLGIDMGAFDFGLGVFFESKDWYFERIDRGVSARIGIKVPDIFFFSAEYLNSFGAYSEVPGNRTLEHVDAELGFWLKNILASANIEKRQITISETRELRKMFVRTKVFGRLDIYGKNVPLTIRLDGGVIFNEARFEHLIVRTTKDEATAPYGGLRLGFQISRNLFWYVEGEVPLVISGALSGFLFRVESGCVITLKPQ